MSSNSIQLIVTESDQGIRLDKFLSINDKIKTRSRADYLIDLNLVKVNSKTVKSSYLVKTNDLIEVSLPIEKQQNLEATNIPLQIVFEDKELIVVNKPPNLVVHPSAGHENDTLVNALLFHTKELSMKFNQERPGIVHRIDKDTSGLLVIAKNDFAHEKLVKQFQDRKVFRIYKAVVFGKLKSTIGRIESNIGRHPKDRKKFASVEIGKWSATTYKVLSHNHQLSYLELKLETGRTHQIRVHLSEMGHPLVGDLLYGADKKIKSIESKAIQADIKNLSRFLLHAEKLGFFHPQSENWMEFSIDWPAEVSSLLEKWKLK
jgi:23S rRNA pseudouridine1911/1915/1917 synthase